MPDSSQVQPVAFNCEGGLILNRSNFIMQPGEALQLENFEPDISGGYRRINGFRKYVNAVVPITSTTAENVLMTASFADKIIAARGEKIFSSASTELSIAIASGTGMTGSGTITVPSTTGFSSSGTIQINSELFTYTGVNATTFTGVTRATSSTTAAAHTKFDVVSENWTVRDTGRTNAAKYHFERYNFDGNEKIICVDGVNAPVIFNSSMTAADVSSSLAGSGKITSLGAVIASNTNMAGSGTITVSSTAGFISPSSGTQSILIGSEIFTYTGFSDTTFTGVTRAAAGSTAADHTIGDSVSDLFPPAVTGAKIVAAFKEHMFYAGMPNTPQEIVFSLPFDEDNFSVALGAGSISVDDTVVALKVFRDSLFIFCENRIFKLTGSSQADFSISAVTRNIGCINSFTVQEFAGDLIFLGPDGLRTVAATARIGDTELGTISKNIQTVFDENIKDAGSFDSVVIPDKTQYRIFFTKDGQGASLSKGAICVLKKEAFEFSETRGIKVQCTDTFIEAGNVIVVHGDTNGFVQRQESGDTFDGTIISGKYRSPDMSFGDNGIRKHMQRVIINYKPEGTVDADLIVRYDNEDKNSARPAVYPFDNTQLAATYGNASYSTSASNAQFVYGGPTQPLVRQPVEGSGFSVALKVEDGGSSAAYSLKGFQLEYQLGARR
jgi:hypothetical protein